MSSAALFLSLLSLGLMAFVFTTKRTLREDHLLRADTLESFLLAVLTGAFPMAIATLVTSYLAAAPLFNLLIGMACVIASFVLLCALVLWGGKESAAPDNVKPFPPQPSAPTPHRPDRLAA